MDAKKKNTERNPHGRRITRKQRKRQIIKRLSLAAAGVAAVLLLIVAGRYFIKGGSLPVHSASYQEYDIGSPTKQTPRPELDVQLLTVNPYSRPGTATDGVKGVVVHYTANPGSTAQNNHDYFENLKDTKETSVSSNFIIGLDGEIIQCVPTAEVAYASNSRNNDTVSIECCHPDETGKLNDATYDSLVELVAFLCGKFDLGMEDVIRHYDVTGKDCPKYFVEHEDAWQQFRADVAKYIEENG